MRPGAELAELINGPVELKSPQTAYDNITAEDVATVGKAPENGCIVAWQQLERGAVAGCWPGPILRIRVGRVFGFGRVVLVSAFAFLA